MFGMSAWDLTKEAFHYGWMALLVLLFVGLVYAVEIFVFSKPIARLTKGFDFNTEWSQLTPMTKAKRVFGHVWLFAVTTALLIIPTAFFAGFIKAYQPVWLYISAGYVALLLAAMVYNKFTVEFHPPFVAFCYLLANLYFAYTTSYFGAASSALIAVISIAAINAYTYLFVLTGAKTELYMPKAKTVGGNHQQEGEIKSAVQYHAVAARFNFSNVAGMADLKAKLLKAGKQILDKNNADPKNGVLFHGDPGNGKTFFAEALAGELKLKFISATFGNIVSQWVGETTQRAMKVFDDAEAQAPCLLFLDEIDSVFVDRGSIKNADSEAPKTLNAILTRLVDIRKKGVVVVAATNFLDKLDPASIREGRFDYKIEITNPDFEARKSLLTKALKHIKIDNETLDSLARRWEGYSVSRIMAIGDAAKDIAMTEGLKTVDFELMMEALRSIQGTKGDKIPESVPTVDGLFLTDPMRARMNNLIERMVNIEEVEKFGGNAPNGVLFHGPAGTGKTLGAMVMAKSANWSFIQTTGNALLSNPDEIDNIMKRAKDIRPCLVFIDEGDDVLADRNSSMNKSVTNRLLSVMDGAGGRPKDVLFVAATNYPEMIDSAMLRGGRFTEKIEFSLPDIKTISDYVRNWIDSTKAPLSEDFTVENVANIVRGQSLANVKVILQGSINESIGKLSKDKNARVDLNDLRSAMNLVFS